MRKAVVLLSGGLDSATVLAIAQADGFDCYALSFDYGQRHATELDAAKRIAALRNVARHAVARIDLRMFGGSALTDDIDVPRNRDLARDADSIPVTYVPARNTIFLSFALAWAEVLGAEDIFIGVNAVDYSGYPDCRPEYIAAYQDMAALATRAGVEGNSRITIHTPLIKASKPDIVRMGIALGVDYSLTSSCYDPDIDATACGECDSCQIRLAAFQKVGLTDPVSYRGARAIA
jgi:7-cyano-7-deazaguanine synthase